MKKVLCAALLCAFSVSLWGCSRSEPSVPSPSSQTASAAAADSSGTAAASVTTQMTTAAANGLRPNTLKAEQFVTDGQFKTYTENGATASENGATASAAGIDVSSYSGSIDWYKVKNAGVTFGMVRLGGRGYGDSGALYADEQAAAYMRGAQAAGLHTGGYFFSQATTPEEAREEAAYCREVLGDLTPDYPVAYDWEFIKDDEARTAGMTVAQTTACARAFFDEIKSYGWTPMLYAGEAEMTAKYDMAQLGDCEIWYTEYAAAPVFPYTINMWQYANTGVIDGIEGNVDLDIRFIYHT